MKDGIYLFTWKEVERLKVYENQLIPIKNEDLSYYYRSDKIIKTHFYKDLIYEFICSITKKLEEIKL